MPVCVCVCIRVHTHAVVIIVRLMQMTQGLCARAGMSVWVSVSNCLRVHTTIEMLRRGMLPCVCACVCARDHIKLAHTM